MKNSAFTLVELLVVVAIIALLTAVILPNILGSRSQARDSERVSDLSQLAGALELYYDRCGQYPTTLVTTASNGCPSTVTFETYMSKIPTPPTGASSYDYIVLENSDDQPVSYVLHTTLENKSNPEYAKSFTYSGSILQTVPNGYSWSPSTNTEPPFSNCGSASTDVDYCIAPQ